MDQNQYFKNPILDYLRDTLDLFATAVAQVIEAGVRKLPILEEQLNIHAMLTENEWVLHHQRYPQEATAMTGFPARSTVKRR